MALIRRNRMPTRSLKGEETALCQAEPLAIELDMDDFQEH